MGAVNVEIVLKQCSNLSHTEVIGVCRGFLNKNNVRPGDVISKFCKNESFLLYEDVDHIIIDGNDEEENVNYSNPNVNWYVYKLDRSGPQSEVCEDESGDDVHLSTYHILPSQDIFSIWENLVYESRIKENLLNYAFTMMEFSDKGVNTNVISCNRVILLHGPPGTGKTSLCKALAQKLCIRMRNRYKQSMLIEINSHSLFSKWFSESGKLVAKMFNEVKAIVEIPTTLVCLLIDEIESLAHARDQCLSGNEPSDSIKVVNAVLTQIDQIKRYPNVLILTTSNMTAAIDVAFVDRADIKQYIGPPAPAAIYKIYLSCIQELIKADIIISKHCDNATTEISDDNKELLKIVSEESVNLSGRMLRKIPFLTHAIVLNNRSVNLGEFLEGMLQAVKSECSEREHFLHKPVVTKI